MDIVKMKNYLGLTENEILKYANRINANRQMFDIKKYKIKINKCELAAKYNEKLINGECKSYADLARAMNCSRAWITKVMKHLS